MLIIRYSMGKVSHVWTCLNNTRHVQTMDQHILKSDEQPGIGLRTTIFKI